MSKKKIVLILLAIIFGGYAGWQLLMPNNFVINDYKWRYEEMSKPEYLKSLRDFCKNNLSDSIENLNYSQLVIWEHKYLTYSAYQFERAEMPIAILNPYIIDGRAFGRCGEFSLCINGLLLANGYKTRLVVDISKPTEVVTFVYNMTVKDSLNINKYPDQKVGKIIQDSIIVKVNDIEIKEPTDVYVTGNYVYFVTPPQAGSTIYIEYKYYKVAGDHVWVEVWAENRWIHIDPTEQRFDDKFMYITDWNKEINEVIAITKDDSDKMMTIDVTKDYQ